MSMFSDSIQQANAITRLARENPEGVLVLATYTREEFQELRPGENYDDFTHGERLVMEMLPPEIARRLVFQEIDSVGFYRFLAATGRQNDLAARSAYAAMLFNHKTQQR